MALRGPRAVDAPLDGSVQLGSRAAWANTSEHARQHAEIPPFSSIRTCITIQARVKPRPETNAGIEGCRKLGNRKPASGYGVWATVVAVVCLVGVWNVSAFANPPDEATGAGVGAPDALQAPITPPALAPSFPSVPSAPPLLPKPPTTSPSVRLPSAGAPTSPSPLTGTAASGAPAVHSGAADVTASPAAGNIGSVASTSTLTGPQQATAPSNVEGHEGSDGSSVRAARPARSDHNAGLIEASRIAPLRKWFLYVWPAVALGRPSLAALLSKWGDTTLVLISDDGPASLGAGLTEGTQTDTAVRGNPAPSSGFPTLTSWLRADPFRPDQPLPISLVYIVVVGGVAVLSLTVRREMGAPLSRRRRRV